MIETTEKRARAREQDRIAITQSLRDAIAAVEAAHAAPLGSGTPGLLRDARRHAERAISWIADAIETHTRQGDKQG